MTRRLFPPIFDGIGYALRQEEDRKLAVAIAAVDAICMSLAMPFVGSRLRIFTANRLIDVAWALRWLCKSCARRLLGAARRLVPEAERYFVRRF